MYSQAACSVYKQTLKRMPHIYLMILFHFVFFFFGLHVCCGPFGTNEPLRLLGGWRSDEPEIVLQIKGKGKSVRACVCHHFFSDTFASLYEGNVYIFCFCFVFFWHRERESLKVVTEVETNA